MLEDKHERYETENGKLEESLARVVRL